MIDVVSFFNRNWFKTLSNVLNRYCYPDLSLVDKNRIKAVQTEYGSFYYTKALQQYYNLFEQVEEYKADDLGPEDVVLDIGANIGAFTVLAAKRVKYVFAVEPLFYPELQANVGLNGLENVTCLPFALGEGDSFEINFCGKTKIVRSMEFDDILARCHRHPNFLKIDCEGGEWTVDPAEFKSFRAVEAEVHKFNGERLMDFVDMLQGAGFTCRYYSTPEGQLMVSARRGIE